MATQLPTQMHKADLVIATLRASYRIPTVSRRYVWRFPPLVSRRARPLDSAFVYLRAARIHMKNNATDSPAAKPTATRRPGSGL